MENTTPNVRERLQSFFAKHIEPNNRRYHEELAENRRRGDAFAPLSIVEQLKPLAREAGLWNLFLPRTAAHPERLSTVEYAALCEIMGHIGWASEVFNCSAPDTGNMEVLEHYGTEAQQREWLEPLLRGEIRSAFLMTEPQVASSDATNIACSIRRDGDHYIITGRKWWSTGANDPRCKLFLVMGKTAPDAPAHQQQSMILVPKHTPGVTVVRNLTALGYDDAPQGHAEVDLDQVRVPCTNILLGEGRGFEIAQGRLGPGRVHHCMRSIGAAEASLTLMCRRLHARVAFGKPLSEQSIWHERIAESRCAIDQARQLVLHTADLIDRLGNKAARKEIAMIKVVVPNMLHKLTDWAIQAHGGAGLSEDFPLSHMHAVSRMLRIVDGPDEVHRYLIARMELGRQLGSSEHLRRLYRDTRL